MISNASAVPRVRAAVVQGLIAGLLGVAGCGAEGEGTIKAPPGGGNERLGRLSGDLPAPSRSKKARAAKVKDLPPDATNPRS